MSAFDYGNARLRAMKSRLLGADLLARLTHATSVENLLAELNRTAYAPSVEAALVRSTGLTAMASALREALVNTLGRLQSFYTGRAAAPIDLLLYRYDVLNVKTILRGVSQNVPPETIIGQTLPAGVLKPPALTELARAESVPTVVAILATWRSPLASPLLALAAEQPQAEMAAREVALDQWWATAAWQASKAAVWRAALVEQIDGVNIMTAVRLNGVNVDDARLQAQFLTLPEAGSGLLSTDLLMRAARAADIRTAVAQLAATPYAAALTEALSAYSRTRRGSAFEFALLRRQIQRAARAYYQDPLGVGVPLGFAALQGNEIRNLRIIGHGLYLGDAPDQIADRLFIV